LRRQPPGAKKCATRDIMCEYVLLRLHATCRSGLHVKFAAGCMHPRTESKGFIAQLPPPPGATKNSSGVRPKKRVAQSGM